MIDVRDRLIVALDVPTTNDAERLVRTLGDTVGVFKVGLQLQLAANGSGLRFVTDLVDRGKSVFLDCKLLDIPETVERAVENATRMGVRFLTVHCDSKTVGAAVRGRGTNPLQILAVTVLTSIDANDLKGLGITEFDIPQLVSMRAQTALNAGANGVIASGEEIGRIREVVGSKLKIVTPGIRRRDDAAHDQRRITTPAQAVKAGADYLVVGRPVTKATDPRRAAEEILEEMAAAASPNII